MDFINEISVSGVVDDIVDQGEKGYLIMLTQKVYGKFKTIFPIFAPNFIRNDILKLKIAKGDTIYISAGKLYDKVSSDGKVDRRIRITSVDQVSVIARSNYDLGSEKAEKKFEKFIG